MSFRQQLKENMLQSWQDEIEPDWKLYYCRETLGLVNCSISNDDGMRIEICDLQSADDLEQIQVSFGKSIERGCPAALNALGWMYLNGICVPVNYEAAMRMFRLSDIRGSREGAFNRGLMYERGLIGEVDLNKTLEIYRRAYDKGLERAAYQLAECYWQNRAMDDEYLEAAVYWCRCYMRHIAPGDTEAAALFGRVLTSNELCDKDVREGSYWLQCAALAGDLASLHLIVEEYELWPKGIMCWDPDEVYLKFWRELLEKAKSTEEERESARERESLDRIERFRWQRVH